MKHLKIYIVCLVAFFHEFLAADDEDACNTMITTSYGLRGLSVPREGSIVCPYLKWNCCHKEDELYMHKYYTKYLGKQFLDNYNGIDSKTSDIKTMMEAIQAVNFTRLATFFNNTINCQGIARQVKFAGDIINATNLTEVTSLFPNMTENLTEVYKKIGKVREGFYCSICDLNAHQNIDLDTREIVYSNAFCNRLVDLSFEPLFFKFNKIYGYMMTFDMIVNATRNSSIFSRNDLAELTRINEALISCAGLTTKKDCKPFCRLFSFNENTVLFDGDSLLQTRTLDTYRQVLGDYLLTPTRELWFPIINATNWRVINETLARFRLALQMADPNALNIIRGLEDVIKEFSNSTGFNATRFIMENGGSQNQTRPERRLFGSNGYLAPYTTKLTNLIGQTAINEYERRLDQIKDMFPSVFHGLPEPIAQNSESAGVETLNQPQFASPTENTAYAIPSRQEISTGLENKYPPQGGRLLSEDDLPAINLDGLSFGNEQQLLSNNELQSLQGSPQNNGGFLDLDQALNQINVEQNNLNQERRLTVEQQNNNEIPELPSSDPKYANLAAGYYELDLNGFPIAGPFATPEGDEHLPGGRPRKLMFNRMRQAAAAAAARARSFASNPLGAIGSAVSGAVNAVGGAVRAVGGAIGNAVSGAVNAAGNLIGGAANALGLAGGRGTTPDGQIINSTNVTNATNITLRRRGVDYFATRLDKLQSLNLFGKATDIVATYQRMLNASNFIPDADNLAKCKIYPVRPNPIDLVNFTYIVTSNDDGIDLFDSTSGTFFEIEIRDLIAQLFSNELTADGNRKGFDEAIISLLKATNKDSISSFLTDYTKSYKVYKQPWNETLRLNVTIPLYIRPNKTAPPRSLNSEGHLVSLIATISIAMFMIQN
jgi:hypothetical protein